MVDTHYAQGRGKETEPVGPVPEFHKEEMLYIEPAHKVDSSFIEDIVRGSKFKHRGETGTFEDFYRSSFTIPEKKYALACALIEDGRYKYPRFLLDEFLPTVLKDDLTPLEDLVEETTLEENRDYQLKNSLRLRLLAKGHIDLSSEEADKAYAYLDRIIERNEKLKRIRDVLPDDIQDAVLAVEIFSKMTDKQRLEEIHAWMKKQSLIRKYVGTLRIYRPTGEVDYKTYVETVPPPAFRDENTATYNIIQERMKRSARRMFYIGHKQQGFAELNQIVTSENNQDRRYFHERIIQHFKAVDHLTLPSNFVSHLPAPKWTGLEVSPFPLIAQKELIYEFEQSRSKLEVAETGAGKTGMGFGCMDQVGVKRGLIIGPAKAGTTWPEQAQLLYKPGEKPQVFVVRNRRDLEREEMATAEFVYISTELLSKAKNDKNLYERLEKALCDVRLVDGVTLDESDELKNSNAAKTQVAAHLLTKIRERYEREANKRLPMLALTATPISTGLSDLDVTMALLYPELFALPGEETGEKSTFSLLCTNNPEKANLIIQANKLIHQITLEDLYGGAAPQFSYEMESFRLTPSQEVLYHWIESIKDAGLFEKARPLEGVTIYPELARRLCIKRGWIPAGIPTKEEALALLDKLHTEWTWWYLQRDERIPEEEFGRDWIAKWRPDDYLRLELNPLVPDGLDSLRFESPSYIREDWYEPDAPSPKLAYVFDQIEKSIVNIDGVDRLTRKIVLVSPEYQQGVTNRDDEIFTILELLQDRFPQIKDSIIGIDGTDSFRARDQHAVDFRSTDRFSVVVVSERSINKSRNWAIEQTPETKYITEALILYLSSTWTFDRLRQLAGRFLRPGLTVDTRTKLLECFETLDYGKRRLIHFDDLLARLVLNGALPTGEDAELFYDHHKRKVRLVFEHPRTEQLFLRDIMKRLMGIGVNQIKEQLSQTREGKTLFQRLAEAYYNEGRDELRPVGNNAGLVANVLASENVKRVISIGAGTCLFARKLAKIDPTIMIDNIDINPEMLSLAKEKHPEIGNIVEGDATKLPEHDETYDAVDMSYVLHWLQLYKDKKKKGLEEDPMQIERVQALFQANRVLKRGGTFALTFPESSFDEEMFLKFSQALEKHFGFETVQEYSGMTFADTAEGKSDRRIGWMLTLTKTKSILGVDGLNLHDLSTRHDEPYIYSEVKEKDTQRIHTVTIDYPMYTATSFAIRNPVTGEETSVSGKPTVDIPPTVDTLNPTGGTSGDIYVNGDEDPLIETKFNLPKKVTAWARREVESMLGTKFVESEQVALAILTATTELRDATDWIGSNGNLNEKLKKIFKVKLKKRSREFTI